jgi:hypothetical protein
MSIPRKSPVSPDDRKRRLEVRSSARFIYRLFVVSLIGLAACSAPSQDVVPSADHPSGASPAEFELSDSPAFTVGLGPEMVFDRVAGALFLGPGLAIADQNANRILLLDTAGMPRGSIGGEGQGPGEFAGLAGIVRYGGGLVAWDQTLLRLSVLDSTGGYASSTVVRPPTWRRASLLGVVGNAALFRFWETGFRGERQSGPVEIRRDDLFSLVRLHDGVVLRTDTVPGDEELAMREGAGGLHGAMPVHFGASSSGAVAGGRAYVGSGDDPELHVFNEARDFGRVTIDHVGIPVRDSWTQWAADTIRARIDAVEPGIASTNDGRNFMMAGASFRRSLLAELPARPVLPVFSRLLGGFDGRLWVRQHPIPESENVHWVAMGADLQPELKLYVPLDLEVLDLDRNRALVLERGPFGETLISVYQLVPR